MLCDKLGGEWAGLKDRILSFGPGVSCGCILIDAREGIGGDLCVTDNLKTHHVLDANFQSGRQTLLMVKTQTLCRRTGQIRALKQDFRPRHPVVHFARNQ